MAFKGIVTDRALLRADYRCEACGVHWLDFDPVSGDAPIDLHSSTTLHIVKQENGLYVATSTPDGHKVLKNRVLRVDGYYFYQYMEMRPDDAFCLCNRCHLKVHAWARKWSKDFLGSAKDRNNDVPFILDYVTVMYVLNKGRWAP